MNYIKNIHRWPSVQLEKLTKKNIVSVHSVSW